MKMVVFTITKLNPPARVFNYNEKMSICYGDSVVISATKFNNYNSYSWLINPTQEINQDESNLGLVVTNSSTIYVTVSDYSSACSFTDELDLIVLNPVIESNDDFGIVRGQSATLSVTSERLTCGAQPKLLVILLFLPYYY